MWPSSLLPEPLLQRLNPQTSKNFNWPCRVQRPCGTFHGGLRPDAAADHALGKGIGFGAQVGSRVRSVAHGGYPGHSQSEARLIALALSGSLEIL